MKKILEIKKGEYLLDVMKNSVKTTYHKRFAMDISHWSLEQLGYIVDNLKKVGYTKSQVLTIVEEVKEEFTVTDDEILEEEVEEDE